MKLSGSVKILEAELHHVLELVQLVNKAYRGESSRVGWTHEADLVGGQRVDKSIVTGMINCPDSCLLRAASEDAELLGCVLLENKRDRVVLGLLTVDPERQNFGIGKSLLKKSEEWIRANWKLQKLEIHVIFHRNELIDWYERHGFKKVGKRLSFPYGQTEFGEPLRSDLEFEVLEKTVSQS